jgi:hypothetical protein
MRGIDDVDHSPQRYPRARKIAASISRRATASSWPAPADRRRCIAC